MNSLKFAFLASVIVVAACQKPPTVEDPPPAAPAPNAGTMVTETEIAIPAELVDEAFAFGKSTFTIKKGNSFEIMLDADQRSYERDGSRDESSSCLFKITGSLTLTETKVTRQTDPRFSANLDIKNASVISTSSLDIGNCNKFADGLFEKKSFKLSVNDFNSEFISFNRFYFDVDDSDKSSSYARAINRHAFNNTQTGDYTYFVKQESQVRVTSLILPQISGSYSHGYGDSSTEVTIVGDQVLYKDKVCGLNFEFTIASIYFDSEGLKAVFSAMPKPDLIDPIVPGDGDSVSENCRYTKVKMENLTAEPMVLSNGSSGDEKYVTFSPFLNLYAKTDTK